MSNDIDAQVIQITHKALGKYVKKPPLTEKLLRKPPFRFLHDVVSSVIRETGFLKGLYSERELVSENVKDKDDKIAFLNKLIDATKAITGTELTVRSSKIIAGLEPTETNLLLQAIGTALDKKLSSADYIAQLKAGKKVKSQSNIPVSDKKLKTSKSKEKVDNKQEGKTKVSSTPRTTNRSQDAKPAAIKTSDKVKVSKQSKESARNEAPKSKEKKTKEKTSTPREKDIIQAKSLKKVISENELVDTVNALNEKENSKFQEPQKPPSAVTQEEETEITTNDLNTDEIDIKQDDPPYIEEAVRVTSEAPAERIKSAKPRRDSLKVDPEKPNQVAVERLKSAKPRSGSNLKTEEEPKLLAPTQFEKPLVRPRSSLRPPSVRPSSARPGAPRLRSDTSLPEGEVIPLGKVNVIIESYNNKEADEEETVTIQAAPEPEFQAPILQLPTDKGHLVEQILEQIQNDDVLEHTKSTVNIEWEQDGFRNRNAASKEIEQLKAAIQTLTKTANPLGKLVNYLHEDIEAMHSELDMWINSARQIMVDVASQKRISDESNKPLQTQLEEIEDTIIRHQQQIVSVHGNILRNEQHIQDLLIK